MRTLFIQFLLFLGLMELLARIRFEALLLVVGAVGALITCLHYLATPEHSDAG